jgi:hypothetical protein
MLKLMQMGTKRVQMKGVLRWLFRWALHVGTQDFWPALADLVGPLQNIKFFFPYSISIHLSPSSSKPGRMSLNVCLWI